MICVAPVLALLSTASPVVVDHQIQVRVDPKSGALEVTDKVSVPPELQGATFALHKALVVEGGVRASADVKLNASVDHAASTERALWTAPNTASFTLKYRGKIQLPPVKEAEAYARAFQRTPGTIQAEGVYLSAGALWIPRFGDELFTFKIDAQVPEGWRALSEGTRVGENGWQQRAPVDDIHLVAAPFWVKEQKLNERVTAMAYLRSADPALAHRYLSTTGRYLEMYEALIGPYPYDKFALVENFWETGYGMPSFTLLGPEVIRFPFILHSSYPHELLHNWWGNSVFLEDGAGNWCEGLTAYLADHLVQEQRGKGAAYRQRLLSKYRDFVDDKNDFPLTKFVARTGSASEAIGYGKWAMVLHMLRRELGDQTFIKGLKTLYADHRQARAGFDDVEAAFAKASGRDLSAFFAAWITRTGAPNVRWSDTRVYRYKSGRVRLELTLEQTQRAAPYPLSVPVRVDGPSGPQWLDVRFDGDKRSASGSIELKQEPTQIDIDPNYDVFRALHPFETAPSLSLALGAEKRLFVLPSFAGDREVKAWRTFANTMCRAGGCEILVDKDVKALPRDRAVWILGYGNQLRGGPMGFIGHYGASLDDARFLVDQRKKRERQANGEHALAIALRNPRAPERGMVFVTTHDDKALAGLARKLPHYGKYGYLAFKGSAPDNVVKGQWAPVRSPLRVVLKGDAKVPRDRPAKALASLPPPFDSARMKATVKDLASKRADGRAPATLGSTWAQKYIKGVVTSFGLSTSTQCFETNGTRGCNLIVRVPGRDKKLADVVLGAHFDHLGVQKGRVHPGANDNASGVAVALEVLAEAAAAQGGARGLEVVFFDAEEKGLLGSRYYLSKRKTSPFAMVNLDTVGRSEGRPFIIFGSESASEWVHIFRGIGFVSGVKTVMGDEKVQASDHVAFLEKGIPAVHIFSGAEAGYHKPTDVAARVDARSLSDAATLASETVRYLLDRTRPLTKSGAGISARPQGGARRVSLGSVPDFNFKGPGVRITGVSDGSPAAKAQLRAGDVLLALGARELKDLRALSEALKSHKPGDRVKLRYRRGNKTREVEVTLQAR